MTKFRETERRYERGENRRKHVGSTGSPEVIKTQKDEWLGLCPMAFPRERRLKLLREAVPSLVAPPYSIAFPKRLYAVDQDGTICTAQTSNPGDSYHGYPYAGRMGKHLIAALRVSARDKKCEKEFDLWIKRYIVLGGPPDL